MEISFRTDGEVDTLPDDLAHTPEERQSRLALMLEPGQIWVVEQAFATALSALHRDALGRANVVLYDRALAPLVAKVLPIGTYAEPLPYTGAAGAQTAASAISPRAFQFAADGWSVVQLVEAHGGWRRRLLDAAIYKPNGCFDVPLLAIATTAADRHRRRDGRLRDLAAVVAEFDDDELLTLILGPLGVRYPSQGHAFTANGLAG